MRRHGGTRQLGIPTVSDRLIQQARLQVLTPIFDRGFSESSYGYRPGCSAQQAIKAMKARVGAGHRWMVDLDLASFFDRVNHDLLMARVARRIHDKRVLRLIRRYLEAGMLQHGLPMSRTEGTPQGGPLSPLLANILLDDMDKELERRGHRYAATLHRWMLAHREKVPNGSAAGLQPETLGGVTRYLDDGGLPIDNNRVEN